MEKAKDYETHPSYGMIQCDRVTHSRGEELFGSKIQVWNSIRLTISTARVKRGLNRDRFFADKCKAVVYLTPAQFAEMITSMNHGEGVPCTIGFIDGNNVEETPWRCDRSELHIDEHDDKMEKVKELVRDVNDTLDALIRQKKQIGKNDANELLSKMKAVQREIGVNADYEKRAFKESLEEMVSEAKSTIVSFAESYAMGRGMDAIRLESADAKDGNGIKEAVGNEIQEA